MKHKELTQAIIGAAIAVLKELKPEAKLSCKRVVRGGPEEATKQGDGERGATTDEGL